MTEVLIQGARSARPLTQVSRSLEQDAALAEAWRRRLADPSWQTRCWALDERDEGRRCQGDVYRYTSQGVALCRHHAAAYGRQLQEDRERFGNDHDSISS